MSSDDKIEYENYVNDKRIACRYGRKCYQKNAIHHEKYKHPPKKNDEKIIENPRKKRKIEEKESENVVIEQTSSNGKIQELKTNKEIENLLQLENKVKCLKSTPNLKRLIKEKFLMEMPDDFYQFWEFSLKLNKHQPEMILDKYGLKLVGPYDILAQKIAKEKLENDDFNDKFLIHWRYYHDIPEFQTVLKGDATTGHHIGYFRNTPNELPIFMAANCAEKNGQFTKMGENIFAAINIYLDEYKKTANPFEKMAINQFLTSLKTEANRLNLNLNPLTNRMKNRKILTITMNKLGLNVPYDEKTEVGYRPLPITEKQLNNLLDKIANSDGESKTIYISKLQEIITYINIACDECDFGTGIEFGWNLLSHHLNDLNQTIARILTNSYRLLNWNAFAKIINIHMKMRHKTINLDLYT